MSDLKISSTRGAAPALHLSPRSRIIRHVVALVHMARPLMLAAGILVYALGVSMGAPSIGEIRWTPVVAGLIAFLAANLCAHFADEYADRDTDALNRRTWFSGGSGVLPAGLVTPAFALRAALIAAACALLTSVAFVALGWLSYSALGLIWLGLVGGWCYSMPPLALERRGWGEITNALLGALLIPLLGFTSQRGAPTLDSLLALTPVFTITMVNLLGVHWADRHADAAVGKRTLVVILGKRTLHLHRALVVLTYGLTWLLADVVLPLSVAVAITLTLPISMWATGTFTRRERDGTSSIAMAALMIAASVGWLLE
ncbi:MAG: prenyltransferase [Thermoflexales bacterium]|nr:prenyltransferase [Thermoflexales bacterium]